MKKRTVNSSRMPIYRDAGFELYNAGLTAETFEKEKGNEREPDDYIYSRYRNPTVVSAEEEIMKIEECRWALLTQSGMAAIDIALSIFQKAGNTGPWLFFNEIYGGTISFVESVLRKRRGLDVHYFNPSGGKYNMEEFEETMARLKPELVYTETISNPMVIVADIPEIIRISKKYGAKVIVDNTFATPMLIKPLNSGADVVIHSATKYFSGHGNLTAGVLCGNDMTIMHDSIEYRKFVGHMLSPDDAYRLQTQAESFSLRFTRQCSNAFMLAKYLNDNENVGKVWYPGLKDHPTHEVAKKLFGSHGYGAIITFDLAGSNVNQKGKRRDRFIELVSGKIKLIPSLGDSRTILMPVEAVWGAKYPEPGMIRLSVGYEDPEKLMEPISAALNSF